MQLLEQFLGYMQSGGFVMWPLAILVLVLWYALGYRFHTLKRGSNANVRNLVRKFSQGIRSEPQGLIDGAIVEALKVIKTHGANKNSRKLLDDLFSEWLVVIKRYKTTIKTIVIVAPLIGLLGTVSGMIETFDSLASAELFSQTGGIAGGISQALFTTQLGLVVAVPGLIMGRMLDKKAANMELELEQIKDILCSEGVTNEI
ncbi:MAG: MotA/TolQ/ExbB proton channel family protein [Helicobacteraceae bacterium]|nr:MotA/TolQ/ExbB proton channel family protein [Helicobacteraceae bacterium]